MLKVLIRVGVLSISLVGSGCDQGYEEVRITVFDFRFIPDQLRLTTGKPVRLLIRNQGRETHRFKSSMLKTKEGRVSWDGQARDEDTRMGIPVHPGKTIEIFLTLPPGEYTFQCPIRGHRGMNGVFIVEEPGAKPS